MQPAHDRGRHHRAHTLIHHGLPAGHLDHRGQPRHRLLDEHITRPADQPRRPRPGHDLHRQDAVAAEVEERIIHTDPLHPEHLGIDPGQDLLNPIGRRAVLIGVRILRRRQRPHIELSVDRQRQPVEHHHRPRNHIARQPLSQHRARRPRIHCPDIDFGHIPHQALVTRAVLTEDHRRTVHPLQRRQRRMNLPQLDAITTDLHLLISTTQILQLPIGAPTHQIPSAIHPRPNPTERTRHKPRGRQPRPLQITHPHTTASHIQLPNHTNRDRPQPLIKNHQPRPGHRNTNRRNTRPRNQRRTHRRINRRLSRTIGINHQPARRPPIHQLRRTHLTTDQQRQRIQTLGGQQSHRRGCLRQLL